MSALREKFRSMYDLRDGWDGYGGKAPTSKAMHEAEFVLATFELSNVQPSLVPTSEGGLYFETCHGDIELHVECLRDGHLGIMSVADGFTFELPDYPTRSDVVEHVYWLIVASARREKLLGASAWKAKGEGP
jgi:hypothetical protein